ncbi:hypothetical protein O988_08473 [Pseudogymnoascus sp. VKM F-3808]|nr:hypothetical protein O988_08473 [Pseudogymnoascus sp. VKM F-3808]
MSFTYRNADGTFGVREMPTDEKPFAEPSANTSRLTDEEASIIHNLVELHLIDPSEEEIFLRRKENQDGLCFDEREERGASGEGCSVLSPFVRKAGASHWEFLLHILTGIFGVYGSWFLSDVVEVMRTDERISYNKSHAFFANGATDVPVLLLMPMCWLTLQFLVRLCGHSIAPILSSIFEITAIVLHIYYPTVPIARDGYKWPEVCSIFVSDVPENLSGLNLNATELLARKNELAGLLCVYPIAAIYLVLVTTRILTAVATLARGTASPGTVMYWLHRRGHTAASGLYLVTAILSTVGASMNIWTRAWYSWHHDMEHIIATWSSSGFPLQIVLLGAQVLAFTGLFICAVAGDAPSGRACRRFSTTMAVILAYSAFTCTMGIIAMDDEKNKWAAETTKPRHIVAVSMTALVSLIHTFIALCPVLTRQASVGL